MRRNVVILRCIKVLFQKNFVQNGTKKLVKIYLGISLQLREKIPRQAAFMVAKDCKCFYRYSGTKWNGTEFPDWFVDITTQVMEKIGIPELALPNCSNVNLYQNGQHSVG
eukprot:UN15868